MKLPHNFTTHHQLQEYLKCIRNLKPGDKVKFYYTNDDYFYGNKQSGIPTPLIKEGAVVCIVPGSTKTYAPGPFDQVPIVFIGNNDLLSFYTIDSYADPYQSLLSKCKTPFTRFISIANDILIASVIKADHTP